MAGSLIRFMLKRKINKSGLVEDYTGIFHPGVMARIPLPETINANGEKGTYMYARQGKTKHLIVALMGGGLSWNAETAKYAQNPETITNPRIPALYAPMAGVMTDFLLFGLDKRPGIVTPYPENLFADWNIVVINYVTGDFHVGNNDFPYTASDGSPKMLHHRGYNNFEKAMDQCKVLFPNVDKLLVMGGSAGAFAVPALAEKIMDCYPDCHDTTVYADSALILYDGYREVMQNVWNAPDELVQAVHSSDIGADWFAHLYRRRGNQIKYLYANSIADYLLTTFQNYIDHGVYAADEKQCALFTEHLRQHVKRLKKEVPGIGICINDFKPLQPNVAGTEHCTMLNRHFMEPVGDECSVMQWVYDAVNGEVYDVGVKML